MAALNSEDLTAMAQAMAAAASAMMTSDEAGQDGDQVNQSDPGQGKAKKRLSTLKTMLNIVKAYNKAFKDSDEPLTSMDAHIFITGGIRMPVRQDKWCLFRSFLLGVNEKRVTLKGITDAEDSFAALEEAIRKYVSDNYAKYKGFSWIPADGTDQAREFADHLMFCSQVDDMNVDQGDLVAGILGNLFDVNVWMFEEDELYQVTEERDKTAPVRKDIFLARSYPKDRVRYFWVSHATLQAQMNWEERCKRVKDYYYMAKLNVGSLILREVRAPKGEEKRYLVKISDDCNRVATRSEVERGLQGSGQKTLDYLDYITRIPKQDILNATISLQLKGSRQQHVFKMKKNITVLATWLVLSPITRGPAWQALRKFYHGFHILPTEFTMPPSDDLLK